MGEDKTFSFLKGVFFGLIAGAVAGVLLAPKSGEETRKEIKKFAKEIEIKAVDIYADARREVKKKLIMIKKAGKKIDESKYLELVSEVISEVRKDATVTSDVVEKLGLQLKQDWNTIKEELDK